jgi:hypothetical protein
MFHRFIVNGNTINSAYWLVAHLAWAENMLLLKGLNGPALSIPWLEKFGFGSEKEKKEGLPDIKDVLHTLNEIHARAMEFLRNIKDEELEEDNLLGFSFGANPSKRLIVHHLIRHESVHAGHLGLIAKMQGIKTV